MTKCFLSPFYLLTHSSSYTLLADARFAAQHVDVRAVVAGKRGQQTEERPYTPISLVEGGACGGGGGGGDGGGAGAGNAGVDGYFEIAVKVYDDGALSRHLAALPPGAAVEMRLALPSVTYQPAAARMAFAGQPSQRVTAVGLVGGGSGVTPFVQLLQAAFGGQPAAAATGGAAPPKVGSSHPRVAFSLLYCSHEEADIMLRRELEALATAHAAELALTYAVSEGEVQGWGRVANGRRVDEALLRDTMPAPGPGVVVLLCGPPMFNDAVRQALVAIGHAQRQVHQL